MPEIRIRYEDDSDRMPYEAIAEVVRTAGKHFAVTGLDWTRDNDLDEETVTIRPDTTGLEKAWRQVAGSEFRPHRLGRGA